MRIYIDSQLADCIGLAPQKCLRVKNEPDGEWELFYDSIEGFSYEAGFQYELEVEVTNISNPSEDGSSLQHKLVTVISKTIPPIRGLF